MTKLVLVEGPGRGATYEIDSGATIGRSRSCAVRLEGRHMSRVHARIEKRADGLYIVDADSRNGVFVSGRKIKEHLLKKDDEIEIGEFVLVFDPSFDPSKGIPERKNHTVAMVLETMADPVAEPVAEADLRATCEKLQFIVETVGLLHAIDDPKGVMKAVLERALAHVRAPRGFVMMADDAGKPLPIAKVAPEGQDEFYVSSVLYHQVSRERRSVLGYDVAKQGTLEGKAVSILCVPLISRDRYLGFLYLDGPRETTTFTRGDLRFVATLARAASAAFAKPPPDTADLDLDRLWKKETTLPKLLGEIERDAFEEALRRASNDVGKAAALVGIPRAQFEARLKEMGVTVAPPPLPPGPVDWKSVEV